MALTRIQLVDFALEQAQLDSSFQAHGRKWLNHAILKLGKRRNYKFYNKITNTPFVAGQREYNLPSDFGSLVADYGKGDACFIVQPNGSDWQIGQEILLLEPYVFDQSNTGVTSGDPNTAMIDLENGKIIFNTAAPQGTNKYWRLRYFATPPQYSLDATDDNVVVKFGDQDVLLQEMLNLAFEFMDDERQQAKKADLKDANRQFERNMYQDDLNSTVDLDRNMFRSRSWVSRRIWRRWGG